MVKGIRTYNGLYYDCVYSSMNKIKAEGKAKSIRSIGYGARTIKIKGESGVTLYRIFQSRRKLR